MYNTVFKLPQFSLNNTLDFTHTWESFAFSEGSNYESQAERFYAMTHRRMLMSG